MRSRSSGLKVRKGLTGYFLPILVAVVLALSACSSDSRHLLVLQANYAFSQGSYLDATVGYLNSLDVPQSREHVAYNLANVYHSLGEFPAALSLWDEAMGTQDLELLFRIHFNRGVLFYEQGQFAEAERAFVSALLIEPNSVDAKINLELALEKRSSPIPSPGRRTAGQEEGGGQDSPQALRIFDYLRRKEGQQWTPPMDSGPEPDVLDW